MENDHHVIKSKFCEFNKYNHNIFKMNPIRPIPINATHRVQSITPMPQVRRTNTFRPMSQSPPPFETANIHTRHNQIEDIFRSPQPVQQPGNIALLARGISLLSITQLRELLREYSLPTGGNKHILVNRLIIFLETFGQNQQNLLTQFSSKLKKLLSVESDEHLAMAQPEENNGTQQLPPELAQRIFSGSPSILFELAPEFPTAFGPVVIQPNMFGFQHNFSISSPPANSIPVLQFIPFMKDVQIKKLTLQIGGMFITLRDNVMWCDVTDYINRPSMIQLISMEPLLPIVALIRWMKKVSIPQLVNKIINETEPAAEPTSTSNHRPNGICPLTRKLIARPARGARCSHAECFDLTGYLCHASKHNSWQCPICHSQLYAEDLRIDPNYFKTCSMASL